MFDFSEVEIGDQFNVTIMSAPGYAGLGDIVTVELIRRNRVDVANEAGEKAFSALACGAQKLEKI